MVYLCIREHRTGQQCWAALQQQHRFLLIKCVFNQEGCIIKAEMRGVGRAGQKERMKGVQSRTRPAHQQWWRIRVTAEHKSLYITSEMPLYWTRASQVERYHFLAFSTAEQLHQREEALFHLCVALEMLQHTPGAFISLNTQQMKVRSLFTVHCAVRSTAGDESSQLMRMQSPLSTPEIC